MSIDKTVYFGHDAGASCAAGIENTEFWIANSKGDPASTILQIDRLANLLAGGGLIRKANWTHEYSECDPQG